MAELMPRLESEFGRGCHQQARDVLVLTEFAWHDCYGEPSPPRDVIDDILLVAGGDLGRLIQASLLAVIDFRDLRVSANAMR